jgi:formylglycine-generating enzyme required for sulfatase activity
MSGMVYLRAGLVQVGPRRVKPVVPPKDKGPGLLPEGEKVTPAPWVSMAGRNLRPRLMMVLEFWIDAMEVTQADYARFLKQTGYRLPHVAEDWAEDGWNWTGPTPETGMESHPVVLISWYDADAYCRWKEKRLPTEAEWQAAALGAGENGRDYPWGDEYDNDALNHGREKSPNFDDSDGFARTAPVGSFPEGRTPNDVWDMFGNVWEFTADRRVDDWGQLRTQGHGKHDELVDPSAPGPALRVAVRGGSFYFDFRPNPGGEWSSFVPEIRRKSAGIRCAVDVR